MGYWRSQRVDTIIDTNTLTNSYDDNTATAEVAGFTMASLYIEYTPAEDASDCYIQLESGYDDANLFPESAFLEEDLTGVSTAKQHILKLEAVTGGVAVKRTDKFPIADLRLRISAKETTAGGYGTIKITLIRNEEG